MTPEQKYREMQRLTREIRSLQNSRDYADEVEAARLTYIIEAKVAKYQRLEESR